MNPQQTYGAFIDAEFNRYADENGVKCSYTPFCCVAREGNAVIAVLTGYSYYNEVDIGDLIVRKDFRRHQIGSQLLRTVENRFRGRGFD